MSMVWVIEHRQPAKHSCCSDPLFAKQTRVDLRILQNDTCCLKHIQRSCRLALKCRNNKVRVIDANHLRRSFEIWWLCQICVSRSHWLIDVTAELCNAYPYRCETTYRLRRISNIVSHSCEGRMSWCSAAVRIHLLPDYLLFAVSLSHTLQVKL